MTRIQGFKGRERQQKTADYKRILKATPLILLFLIVLWVVAVGVLSI